ncbi:MAG: response regulator, partial [Chitinispirillaceae bacterium]|nr:response regulator [Chitinispirillaceae bacterium]
GIIGMTGFLLDTNLSEEQRTCLQIVQKSSRDLLTILNDILDFSKIEANRLELESIEFDLGAAIEDAMKMLSFRAKEKQIGLICEIRPVIGMHVKGDPVRLRQILFNLVGNAIKFTLRGEVTVTVNVQAETARSRVIGCEVRDTGVGISPDKLKLLFGNFQQLDASTTRKFGGTGLGLAIAKNLIELMGGSISVKSSEGTGSTFRFSVMFEKAGAEMCSDNGQSLTSPAVRRPVSAETLGRPVSILIVEDNTINQLVFKKVLEKNGFSVGTAGNGLEAIDALEMREYDIVFMDVQMPGMDGIEATKLIRGRMTSVLNPEVPVIAITANAMKVNRDECVKAGMNDFISKPVTVEAIDAIVERWLHSGEPVPKASE